MVRRIIRNFRRIVDGIGNMVQANSVAEALQNTYHVPTWVTGVVSAVLVWLVLIGGIRRLGEVSGKLVPLMCILYVVGGLVILVMHATAIPQALTLIFTSAFSPVAATGGFAGATIVLAIQYGVARGVFSNEAGLGSAPIAHATAMSNSSVEQGLIAMLGTFIDTIIVCSITGLVIVISGTWTSGLTGSVLSSTAFEQMLPGMGNHLVTISLILFAFTTILGWSFYSEKCVQFLFGIRAVTPYRWLWVLAIPIGAVAKLEFVWLVADTLNALMAIPNLIALLLLSPVIFKLTRAYFAKA
ncbi:MAG: amino acid carrier protein [Thiotrichaceae bacterium]